MLVSAPGLVPVLGLGLAPVQGLGPGPGLAPVQGLALVLAPVLEQHRQSGSRLAIMLTELTIFSFST